MIGRFGEEEGMQDRILTLTLTNRRLRVMAAAFLATLIALMVFAIPANAQDTQLVGTMAQVSNTNGGNNANLIGPVRVSNCEELEVDSDAAVVLRGDDNVPVRVSNSANNFFVSKDGNQLRITGSSGGDLVGTKIGDLGAGNHNITDTAGITCRRDKGDDGNDGGGTGNVASANDLEDLECDELLRRFRKADMGQYGDKARFADVNVSNQIVVCLEQEVVQGTAADEELPETGGVSLLALAALGIVSAVAGVSVIRGARREE